MSVPPPTPGTPAKQDFKAAFDNLGQSIKEGLTQWQKQKRREQTQSTLRPWLLGLIPVLAACLHLMIVADGDPETLRSLVQNLNVTALLLATALPLGSTAVTWLFLFVLVTTLNKPKSERPESWQLSLSLVGVFAGFVDYFAMTVYYAAINFAVFALLVLFTFAPTWVSKLPPKAAERIQRILAASAKAWAYAFVLVPLLIWLGFLGVWLPKERITLGAEHIEPAYVLTYDDRWTKYMDGDHRVHIVATDDITGREIAKAPESIWRQTPNDLWRTWRTTTDRERPASPTINNAPDKSTPPPVSSSTPPTAANPPVVPPVPSDPVSSTAAQTAAPSAAMTPNEPSTNLRSTPAPAP
jgi:hypothetical protein